jgi:hypothetical protein
MVTEIRTVVPEKIRGGAGRLERGLGELFRRDVVILYLDCSVGDVGLYICQNVHLRSVHFMPLLSSSLKNIIWIA